MDRGSTSFQVFVGRIHKAESLGGGRYNMGDWGAKVKVKLVNGEW